jgi:hypothetical protein
MCNGPVGLGANRTLTLMMMMVCRSGFHVATMVNFKNEAAKLQIF